MNSAIESALNDFIRLEKLPKDYADTVTHWFIPLAERLLRQVSVQQQALVIGISGCQGSGKSTLASLLVLLLKEMMGLKSINLSIDDFYLTHSERQNLAKTIHPLFSTRGVPGTHDIDLAVSTIQALQGAGQVKIPRFDKATDDRCPENVWPVIQAPVDVIILEGWCLCIGAQEAAELEGPINQLEATEDENGVWRKRVNQSINEHYLRLYDLVEHLIMLRAPSFEKVFEWRQTQEDKLTELNLGNTDTRIMSPAELKRFIQHYERITRHGLESLLTTADTIFQLSDKQTIDKKIKG